MRKTIKLVSTQQPELTEDQHQLVTHRLRPKRREEWETHSLSNADKSLSTNELLSSMSTKLNPRSISVSSECNSSGFLTEKLEVKVSCLDKLMVPRFMIGREKGLEFGELKKISARKNIPKICYLASCILKTKKICNDQKCQIKQRWKNKLVIEPKSTLESEKLRNYIENFHQESVHGQQIDKDVNRSFPENLTPKAKLTLYHNECERNNLIEILRTVLKMLAIWDSEVGYVQGMNLLVAVIVSHMKDVMMSFSFMKDILKYGNFRKMYINNFKHSQELCENLLNRHIKILMPDLHNVLIEEIISAEIFMPFYLTMFSCVADHKAMPCIIDEFMTKGDIFLDKLTISLLCYLKDELLGCETGEVTYRLGASFIRSCEVNWMDVVDMTRVIQIN